MKGNCFLVLGPSGAGKTVIVNSVTTNRAVTTTTREPRFSEREGVDYYFVNKEEFENMIKNDKLAEWAEYGKEGKKNYYGLTKDEFNKRLSLGDLFIVCTVEGVIHYKQVYPEAITLFVHSSFEDIQKQLYDRGGNQQDINHRISLYNEEMKSLELADFVIQNKYNHLEESIAALRSIIKTNKKEVRN
ncbi:guanylate kinase [Bacillus cereus]|uniref:guanylate kinase n=1 Tax=Bacillus cereus TaxID=1396 RepID=UPI00148215D3|nr:hypothetical protein [Bacillus cereus]